MNLKYQLRRELEVNAVLYEMTDMMTIGSSLSHSLLNEGSKGEKYVTFSGALSNGQLVVITTRAT
jgi:hypothetical protein